MTPTPDPSLPWPLPMAAVMLIAMSEGLRLVAYRCPAGRPTIAWGETDGVRMGDTCTKEQADRWLLEDLQDRVRAVRELCTVDPSPNELGAMVSLAYNIGVAAFAKSTALRQHNAGNRQAAARAFALWNKARDPQTGQLRELAGLTARRARETALYLTPEPGAQPEPVPQAVEPESSAMRGPIATSGASVAGAGGLAAIFGPLSEQVDAVKRFAAGVKGFVVDGLGVPPDWILPIVLIACGWVIVSWRRKQREAGWA